jgi:hypothetical protein
MLAKFPGERANLRDLLRTIDGGRGVATAGVTDEKVRNYLEYFFDNALLVKSSRTGAWALDEGELSLLSRFGAVFDESTDALASLADAREPWLEDEARAQEKADRAQAREAKRAEAKKSEAEHEILVGDEAHALMADQESDSEDEGRKPIAPEPIGPDWPGTRSRGGARSASARPDGSAEKHARSRRRGILIWRRLRPAAARARRRD